MYSYLYSLFDEDDKAVAETYASCKAGGLICGECKERLARKVAEFLEEHRARRERAKGSVEKFLLRE